MGNSPPLQIMSVDLAVPSLTLSLLRPSPRCWILLQKARVQQQTYAPGGSCDTPVAARALQ